MPIPVVCPGCKARFAVSEKFAGKQGPCPKCKALITIPALTEEVKIHVPEIFASAGKDTKGRPLSKPIPRRETKLETMTMVGIAAFCVIVLVVALLLRGFGEQSKYPIITLGLTVLSPALVAAGYFSLRDDELEPYTGRQLWIRSAICGAAYMALWGVYALMAGSMGTAIEMWQWMFIAPLFVSLGGLAALASLDLDFGSGALHYSFYLLVTLLLRWAAGMPPVWNPVA